MASSQRQRKLRLSCDNCYAAKVQCKKVGATCARCESHGVNCNFSVSRRAGKPKRSENIRRPGSVAHSPTMAAPASLCGSDQRAWSSEQPSMDMGLITSEGASAISEGPSPLSSTLMSPPHHPNYATPPFDWSTSTPTLSGLGNVASTTPLQTALYTELSEHVLDSVAERPLDFVPPAWNELSLPFVNDASTPRRTASSSSTTCVQSSPSSSDGQMCRCFGILRESLIMPQHPSLSFDRLLSLNRSVMERVGRVLDCRCHLDVTSTMTLSVILVGVTQCYARAKSGKSILDAGTTLGTLRIDIEDERDIRMMLIRTELCKVNHLVLKLKIRSDRYTDTRDREVCKANVEFLEQRLQQVSDGL